MRDGAGTIPPLGRGGIYRDQRTIADRTQIGMMPLNVEIGDRTDQPMCVNAQKRS